jgi:curved DNA-binding protein CbpA
MNGQLSEHPLAELISEISAGNLSGALRVTRERVKAVIYFDAGELIFASTNVRSYRLAAYLQKRGLVSATQIAAVKNASSDFALAAALLSASIVTRDALDETIDAQVADVLRLLLLWPNGEWSFDDRARLSEATRARTKIKQLLLESTRRMDLKFASSRFKKPNELLSAAQAPLNGFALSPTEGFLLSRVETPQTVSDLAALSGMREPDALRTVYGLVLAGFLKRELWPYVFQTNAPKGVNGSEQGPLRSALASHAPLPGETAKPALNAEQELKEFFEWQGQATSHYEVLDVPASANVSEIRQAYHSLARRFHPDRFHELAGTPTHARLASAFARITQANEVLVHLESRAAYDAKLAALKQVRDAGRLSPGANAPRPQTDGQPENSERGESDAQLAEERFQEGLAALQMRQFTAAISCLSAAARLGPRQPVYRAFYGRALASRPKTRRLAEAELQAAVKLDAGNASYRVMLASLYRDLGFHRRALAELERAVALDPQNSEAREMLKALESNK